MLSEHAAVGFLTLTSSDEVDDLRPLVTRPAARRASTCLVDTTTLGKRDSNVTALMELELVWSCGCRHKQRVNKICHGNTTQRFPDLPTVPFKGQWLVLVLH